MSNIESLRAELDLIHQDLFALLKQRFAITEAIWKIKIEQKLSFTDEAREHKVFHQFDHEISDPAQKAAVQAILKAIVLENKKYLEVKLK
jgi:chorismate mutase